MEYIFTFLEGIASFISPCLLPMIPIYISYFTGRDDNDFRKTILNACGFVLGFTFVFVVLSIFASTLGRIISSQMKYIKIFFGIIIIILGLNYMGVLNFKFLNNTSGVKGNLKDFNFIKSFVFGIIFSISWTPCIGTFLSSALLLVAKHQDMMKGIALMLVYSIGLGIPFIVSIVLIERLKHVFNVIKKHYNLVKKGSGLILVFMGIYLFVF